MGKRKTRENDSKFRLNRVLNYLIKKYQIGNPDIMSMKDFIRHLGAKKEEIEAVMQYKKIVSPTLKLVLFVAFQDNAFAPSNDDERKALNKVKMAISPLPFISNTETKTEKKEEEKKAEDTKFYLNQILADLIEQYRIGDQKVMSQSAFCKRLNMSRSHLRDLLTMKINVSESTKMKLFLAFRNENFKPNNLREKALLRSMKDSIEPMPSLPDELKRPIEELFDLNLDELNEIETTESKYQLNEIFNLLLIRHGIGTPGNMSKRKFFKAMGIPRTTAQTYLKGKNRISTINKLRIYCVFGHQAYGPVNKQEEKLLEEIKKEVKPLEAIIGKQPEKKRSETAPEPERKKTDQPDEKRAELISQVAKALLSDKEFIQQIADLVQSHVQSRTSAPEQPEKTEIPELPEDSEIGSEFIMETRDLMKKVVERLQTIMILDRKKRKPIQRDLKEMMNFLEKTLGDLFLHVRAVAHTTTAQVAKDLLEGEQSLIEAWNR